MQKDLKLIKAKFGEEMSRFCRSNFPTVLETEGLLSDILLTSFHPNKELFEDIKKSKVETEFIKHVNSFLEKTIELEESVKTPFELMEEAGYDLYHCQTEEEVQNFIKYYCKKEELCTFSKERTKDYLVFFAVKKNVDEIKRKDFNKPHRQDAYGTSVISIQFEKNNDVSSLSIKNRYNHTVANPDATFNNNLEKIRKGLTDSFSRHYNIRIEAPMYEFELENYTQANNKFYKYNMEAHNVYYCPDNIVIINGKVYFLEKEKFILMDDYILSLQNKCIYQFEAFNSFHKNKFKIAEYSLNFSDVPTNQKLFKSYILYQGNNKTVTIKINNRFKVFGLENFKNIPNAKVETIKNSDGKVVKSIVEVKNVYKTVFELDANNNFLSINHYYPGVIKSEKGFVLSEDEEGLLPRNTIVQNLSLKATDVGTDITLVRKNLTNTIIGIDRKNQIIKYIDSGLKSTPFNFLCNNTALQTLKIDNVERIGHGTLEKNMALEELILPRVTFIGCGVLSSNSNIKLIVMPELDNTDNDSLSQVDETAEIYLPSLRLRGRNTLPKIDYHKAISPSRYKTYVKNKGSK